MNRWVGLMVSCISRRRTNKRNKGKFNVICKKCQCAWFCVRRIQRVQPFCTRSPKVWVSTWWLSSHVSSSPTGCAAIPCPSLGYGPSFPWAASVAPSFCWPCILHPSVAWVVDPRCLQYPNLSAVWAVVFHALGPFLPISTSTSDLNSIVGAQGTLLWEPVGSENEDFRFQYPQRPSDCCVHLHLSFHQLLQQQEEWFLILLFQPMDSLRLASRDVVGHPRCDLDVLIAPLGALPFQGLCPSTIATRC